MPAKFKRRQSFTSTSVKNKATQEKPPEASIHFYGEFRPQRVTESPRISTAKSTGTDFLKIPTTLTISASTTGESLLNNSMNSVKNKNEENLEDYFYSQLDNRKNTAENDYNERIYTMKKNEYQVLKPPKLQPEKTNPGYFKIQRTKSYYEMLDAIKKRTKFAAKAEAEPTPPVKTESPKIVEFVDFSPNNGHNCFEKRKKEDNGRFFHNKLLETKEEEIPEKRKVIKGFDKLKRPIIAQINNDSPLLDAYKEIVKKSIDQNIEKIKKSKEKEDDKPIEKKYVHLLDQLLEFERENQSRLKLKLNSKVPKSDDDDYEPIYYDTNLSKSENWLLKWSVMRNATTKNLLEIFQKNDTAKKGLQLNFVSFRNLDLF